MAVPTLQISAKRAGVKSACGLPGREGRECSPRRGQNHGAHACYACFTCDFSDTFRDIASGAHYCKTNTFGVRRPGSIHSAYCRKFLNACHSRPTRSFSRANPRHHPHHITSSPPQFSPPLPYPPVPYPTLPYPTLPYPTSVVLL